MKLYKGSNGIDMKNVLRVLGLAVRCDDTVVVEAEGEDEELAVEQLIEAISNMK
ncbi:HPr family phosphocarrier protein [Eubacterium ventriosum]|uniref:HPr family phosphocarrier protein n=1 Tax=Eubacterium ventriosum TaxID=39496 RepID=UPI003AB41DEA